LDEACEEEEDTSSDCNNGNEDDDGDGDDEEYISEYDGFEAANRFNEKQSNGTLVPLSCSAPRPNPRIKRSL
jgi:hypothetical protein